MAFLVKFFPFILAWMFVNGNIRKDKIFFLQQSPKEENELLLVMTWTENEEDMTAGCEILTDEKLINETLPFDDSQIRTLPEDEMQILLGDCLEFSHQRKKRDIASTESTEAVDSRIELIPDVISMANRWRSNRRRGSRNRTSSNRMNERGSKPNTTTTATVPSTTLSLNEIEDEYDKRNRSQNRTSNREIETESEESSETSTTTTESSTTQGYDGLPIIFPGTKWCGAGDIAENYDDLGMYDDTDRCCRAHDLCNDTLAPGETKHGLTNTSPFTKLSCKCDEEFRTCLENVNSVPANTIGNMYFNILRRKCYTIDYPISKTCKKYLTLFKLTCLEYEKDTKKEKIYQWIQTNRYTKM